MAKARKAKKAKKAKKTKKVAKRAMKKKSAARKSAKRAVKKTKKTAKRAAPKKKVAKAPAPKVAVPRPAPAPAPRPAPAPAPRPAVPPPPRPAPAATPPRPATPPASSAPPAAPSSPPASPLSGGYRPFSAPPKPPVPDSALAQLKPLAGTWTCTGHTFAPGPEHPTTATMTLAWHLDGFWLEVRYEEAKAAANPVPLSSVSEWGFDLLQKTLISATVDNGSGVDAQTTAGWQGDKLVFEGSARRFGTQFLDRDTFVRHGDSQLVHTLEASVNDSWIKLHEDTCNRVPSK